ncbi:MAG: hypothetical protein JKY49_00230 [Cohaesibacteraceae bacterium]|nr:hypothetical protein [Cohaesibacteraceae bacterium]
MSTAQKLGGDGFGATAKGKQILIMDEKQVVKRKIENVVVLKWNFPKKI